MWHAHDGMGWWMLFGSIWVILFWALVAWLVVTVVSRVGGRASTPDREESPLDIAARRYAKGEISSDEFEQIRQTLSAGGSPPGPSG